MSYFDLDFFDSTKYKHASAVGDGSTTAFVLSTAPMSAVQMRVCLNGIVQRPVTDFTLSGTTLTFVTAPALAQDIDIFYLTR